MKSPAAHSPKSPPLTTNTSPAEPWLPDDDCVHDVDQFAKTIAAVKSKSPNARPDLLASVLSHYAAKWLPDLSSSSPAKSTSTSASGGFLRQEGSTATWRKKRLLLESLVAALPPEDNVNATGGEVDSKYITCDFLLRLLRAGCMMGADSRVLQELEARAARRLEQASLGEVMIPAFGQYACGRLLDVPLVLRLVRGFMKDGGSAATARVARLVDAYLAEAALEAGLGVQEFEELARAVPMHARSSDDGLYRAVDTYLKIHPNTSKEEKKTLCRLTDARKLSAEASAHAIQNDRLPVRSVMQVLFCEHAKLNFLADWSGSFTGPRSPNPALDLPGRCPSKREVLAQHQEVRRLREDVGRLQMQCHALQAQIDKLTSEKRKRGFFKWSSFLFRGNAAADVARIEDSESGARTPRVGKMERSVQGMATPTKWRKSLS